MITFTGSEKSTSFQQVAATEDDEDDRKSRTQPFKSGSESFNGCGWPIFTEPRLRLPGFSWLSSITHLKSDIPTRSRREIGEELVGRNLVDRQSKSG